MTEILSGYWTGFCAWCSGAVDWAVQSAGSFLGFLNAQPWANRSVLLSGVVCLVIYWKIKRLVKLLFLAGILFALYIAGRAYGLV